MGVTGLWRLIEPTGKPVPVETLENKVLAVDISIWLHQMVKGYQDAKGAPIPNAHLMGLFQRLCKLLYFKIKPVFVFDGGFPDLKRETIAKRQDHKSKYNSESERIKRELALLLSKKSAISSLLGKQAPPKNNQHTIRSNNDDDDLFKLPALPQKEESDSESEEESSSSSIVDLHSVDIESTNFKNLPVKDKYDLLVELKETRKMNSWGKLHEMPKKSDNFSDFQMQRLLKRRKVQECLEETEKEMGETGMSLNELESLLNEEGIVTRVETLQSRRIASNENSRFVLINDLKQALENAKNRRKDDAQPGTSTATWSQSPTQKEQPKRDELEEDLEKAIKMSLECVSEGDTNVCTKTDDSWTSFITESDYSDSEEADGFEQPDMTSAKAYIMQYSDFTHKVINDMISSKNHEKTKSKTSIINQILDEINNEKSGIDDNINLSSDENDQCIKIKIGNNKESVNIQNQHIIQLNTTTEDNEDSLVILHKNNVNINQESVICVNNSLPDVITLDTTTEEEMNQINKFNFATNITFSKEKQTDSSDEDFEEVIDLEKETNKPVVELTLNVGKAPDNDIFADIFTDKYNEKSNESIKIKPTTIEHITSNDDIVEEKLENENISDESVIQTKNFILKPTNATIDIIDVSNTDVANKVQVENENNFVSKSTNYTTTDITNVTGIDVVNKLPMEKENNEKVLNKATNKPKEFISIDKLNTMVEEMETKEQGLLYEKSRLDRIGRNITEQMTKEAQELLQLFGIPYIVAPMEAEAQCAFLESAKLTDGTITDDSDIWLFGGRTVYKNFFNQKKHVLQFLAEKIEKSLNLTREQLVLLALLVGSDYTTGITGVGPVTALEILASFPFNKKHFSTEISKQAQYAEVIAGLQEFKRWVRAGKRTDNTTLKKKLKNVELSEDFPSIRVVQAYLEPNIEKSEEKFTWGEIDITILRDYTKAKFGWSQNKLDEIIKPVLKRMLDRRTQKSVQDYFKRKVELQSLEDKVSKRVKAAIQKMGPEVFQNENTEESEKPKKKRINKKRTLSKDEQKKHLPNSEPVAGPSKTKQKKNCDESVLKKHSVKIVQVKENNLTGIEIKITKSDRVQEIIPQREQDKQSLLQNKLKAIEIFRKTKLDRKRKSTKRRVILPKDRAELSTSSDSN